MRAIPMHKTNSLPNKMVEEMMWNSGSTMRFKTHTIFIKHQKYQSYKNPFYLTCYQWSNKE